MISVVLLIAVAVVISFNHFIPVVNNTIIAVVDLCLVVLAVEVIAECVRMPQRTRVWRIGGALATVAALVLSCVVGFLAFVGSVWEWDDAGSFTRDGEKYYIEACFPGNVVMYQKTSPVTMAEITAADDSNDWLGLVPMPVAMAIHDGEYSGEFSQIMADARRDHPEWFTER